MKARFRATFDFDVEIDPTNEVVKEYDNTEEMLRDCAMHNFGDNLPVIKTGGVKVLDRWLLVESN